VECWVTPSPASTEIAKARANGTHKTRVFKKKDASKIIEEKRFVQQ
jgi:hypothetical protein